MPHHRVIHYINQVKYICPDKDAISELRVIPELSRNPFLTVALEIPKSVVEFTSLFGLALKIEKELIKYYKFTLKYFKLWLNELHAYNSNLLTEFEYSYEPVKQHKLPVDLKPSNLVFNPDHHSTLNMSNLNDKQTTSRDNENTDQNCNSPGDGGTSSNNVGNANGSENNPPPPHNNNNNGGNNNNSRHPPRNNIVSGLADKFTSIRLLDSVNGLTIKELGFTSKFVDDKNKSVELKEFLRQCNEAWEMCIPNQKGMLLKKFKNCVIGGAGSLIEGEEFDSFGDFEAYLIEKFDEPLPFDQQLGELIRSQKGTSESLRSPIRTFEIRSLSSCQIRPWLTISNKFFTTRLGLSYTLYFH
ncbi:hypothetical protein V9T40_007179 [Parthenolecanium corni]|uniref:Uncharacterized protein n=1 Tax=Parthenolecanium corni TaxID=536013 RepID=A0AAN9TVW3_9HEMI